MARIAREHDMVIEGPNCLGMVNYIDGIPLTFVMTPAQAPTEVPGAAIVSQSGALAAVIAVNMRHHAIPLTFSISTGNEACSGIEDYVEHLLGDHGTRVFALVVEKFRQPKRFLDLARRARQTGQFIVLLHPGRSSEARVSAATHTGVIAGDYETMRTLVTHAGVIHVESMEELVDVTQILVRCADIPVGGAAVFTESGAFKALALDLCDQVGLRLPAFSRAAEDALREALPPFILPSNPLDLTAQGLVDPDLYRRTLPPVMADENFGSVVLGIILTDSRTTRLKLPPIVDAITALKPRKPVIFAALDEGAPFDFPEIGQLRALGVPCFPSPERALRALARIAGRRLATETPRQEPPIQHPTVNLREGVWLEAESKTVLAQLGIRTPAGAMAATPQEALHIAKEIGYPIVLKAQSSSLPHKSDAGGVVLNIHSDEALLESWDSLHESVRRARPELSLDGVLVERMTEKGVELIIGARNDPDWGPVLLVGSGGVFAELIKDVRLLPPDLSQDEITQEIRKLRCSRIFQGFRGAPELDVSSVANVVAAIGQLMRSAPQIIEIDINPMVVYANGKGAVALDALLSVAEIDTSEVAGEGDVP
jgi:acyl-CoA synthetase (NDP forming)